MVQTDNYIQTAVITDDIIDPRLTIRKKKLLAIHLFWTGFVIYSISNVLGQNGYTSFAVAESFEAIALVLIFTSAIKLVDFKFDSLFIQFIYLLYCSWLFILIIKGGSLLLDIHFLKQFLFEPTFGGMFYFVPVVMLFPKNLNFYKALFDTIIIFGVLYIIYDIVFIKDLISSEPSILKTAIVELSTDLSFPCAFILLTYKYHSNKRIVFAAVVMVLTLLFSIMRARRGLILLSSTIMLISYFVYLFTSKQKMLTIYLSILVISIGALYASYVYKPVQSNLFGYLLQRGEEDTRTGVEEQFYVDMKPRDWIIGRGINGEYWCPDIEEGQITNYRSVIETGYLQIVLKGGLISLGLFLLLGLFAMVKGFFYSNNLLSKAAAITILWVLMSTYPATINTFTLRYILVWICMGICFSKEIRRMPESIMEEYFHSFIKK